MKLDLPILSLLSSQRTHQPPHTRTLDIEFDQKEMINQGLPAKDLIEGPPNRTRAILLRQTSFRALRSLSISSMRAIA